MIRRLVLAATLMAAPALAQTGAPAAIQIGPADAPVVQIEIPRIEIAQPPDQPDAVAVPAPVIVVTDPAAPAVPPAAPAIPAAVADAVPDDTIETLSYACAGGQTMQVVYVNTSLGNSWAIVLDGDRMVPMTISPSASGAIYKATGADASHELLTKGRTASLVVTAGGREETVRADCVAP